MIPPNASISRTRCPLAIPPIAGLHDICPTRSRLSVINPVSAPRRADADAASQPAWPAPITITSNTSSKNIATYQYKRSHSFLRVDPRLSSRRLSGAVDASHCAAAQVSILLRDVLLIHLLLI